MDDLRYLGIMTGSNYLIRALLVTLMFSCNRQENESKTDANSDSLAMKANVTQNVQDTIEGFEKGNFPAKPSPNSTAKSKEVVSAPVKLADLFKMLAPPPQVFSISTSSDTTLICAEGTRISIKGKSFVSESTGMEVLGRVQVSIVEYYKVSDILLARLSTTSSTNILETGGMIHITATSNNENCMLKQGQNIEIEFPRKIEKEGMQLYTGAWQNDYHIIWKLDKNSSDLNKPITIVDQMPSFPGGEAKMMSYIGRTIKYPGKAKELGIQGTVYIRFVVDREGNVTNARVLRGIDKECDQVALDAVKKMPKFDVGKANGVAVSVNCTLPIRFTLGGRGSKGNVVSMDNFEETFGDSTSQNINIGRVSSYLFSASELGWINCDRLWKTSSAPSVNYVVNIGGGQQATLDIVFHRYKSILNGFTEASKFSFSKIPANEKITLVAVKYVDSRLFFAIKETITSSQPENDLLFQPVTLETLKSEMRKLDNLN